MTQKLLAFALLFLLLSCKTYTLTPDSFKKQLTTGNASEMKDVKVNNPLTTITKISYKANSLNYLNVYDQNNNLFFMQNTPSVEMRVTLKNGKRKIFYLDTVTLVQDTLQGEKSRLLHIKDKVPFADIVKIEVQDGRKNYEYQ